MISMNIIIQSTRQLSKIKKMCKIGIKNYIFYSYGMMQHWMLEPQQLHIMSIAYHQDKPIGIAILRKQICTETYVNIGVYIKIKYRRKGIGSELIKRLKARAPNRNIEAWKDGRIANQFYTSAGI